MVISKKSTILALALGLLAITGCKKEDSGVKVPVTFNASLETTNAKVQLDGNNKPYWEAGDQIRVNDAIGTVTPNANNPSSGTFTVTVSENSDYYAIYPASAASDLSDAGTTAPTINMPRVRPYVTSLSGTFDAPMFAYCANGNSVLRFRNLCSLMKITITNDKAWDLVIDSIHVESTTHKLWGDMSITGITGTTPSLAAPVHAVDSFDVADRWLNTLTIIPSSTTTLESNVLNSSTTNATTTMYVRMPVFDATDASRFYVRVFTHPKWGTTEDNQVHIVYERRQSSSTNAGIGRNEIVPVAVNLSACKPTTTSLKPFSIGANSQVCISRGNAQYFIKTYDATQADCQSGQTYSGTGYWRFSPRPWEFLYTTTLQHDDYSTNKWIEHFTWSSGIKPTHHFKSGQTGSNNRSYFANHDHDWGENFKNITTAGTWYSLSQPEWDYILNDRTTVGNNSKYNYAWFKLTNVPNTNSEFYGIMIIPDGVNVVDDAYSSTRTQLGLTGNNAFKYYYSESTRHPDDNTCTVEQFEYYQALGCIFMPCVGYFSYTGAAEQSYTSASPEGVYWTTTAHEDGHDIATVLLKAEPTAYCTADNTDDDEECYRKLSVRLVRPYSTTITYKYDPFQ